MKKHGRSLNAYYHMKAANEKATYTVIPTAGLPGKDTTVKTL